jgi:hypothetical protein
MSDKLVIEVLRPSGVRLPAVSSVHPEERAGLMLVPGENNVSLECWNAVLTNPAIRIQLAAGILRNKGKGKAVPLTVDWATVSVDKARKLIEHMTDVEKLHGIKQQTKKKKISALCDERIKVVLKDNEKENS